LNTSTPEQFAAMIADERDKAGKLIKAAGIELG
jgi:tripartite-type tricarboxylate transporter receptor subunit TctC